MNTTLKVFAFLFGATLFLNGAFFYMSQNISDFESVPLPPKKMKKYVTHNPVIKVNARSREIWTLVDFSTGKTHQIPDPTQNPALLNKWNWDLGFQRTKIITNGGATNPKGVVRVRNLGPVDFNKVLKIPAGREGYVEDAQAWGDITNKSLADWYVYRTRTHNVESKKNTYLVETQDGHLKLKILNYYCSRKESDCKTMLCTREEAACLSIEYLFVANGEQRFPSPNSSAKNSVAVAP